MNMIRLYRYGSRHTFLTLFGIFAAFNLLSYMYYVSPRLPGSRFTPGVHPSSSLDRFSEQSQRRMEKLADQLNEPSFLGEETFINGEGFLNVDLRDVIFR